MTDPSSAPDRARQDVPWGPLLALGDSLVVLSFAAAGVAFHEVAGWLPLETARIAAPFLGAYGAAALLLGAFREERRTGLFLARSAGAWLLGIGGGLLVRRLAMGWMTPVFAAVTLGYTGALLMGWRTAFVLFQARRRRR